MWRLSRARIGLAALGGLLAVAVAGWLSFRPAQDQPELVQEVEAADREDEADEPFSKDKRKVSDEERAELIARARLWRQPRVPIERASFVGKTLESVTCKFEVSEPGGTTPKFDCTLDDGEEVRIKYGNGPEVPAEAAATRLLHALGFAADEVTLVRRLRCYGCPEEPFSTMKAVGITQAEPLYERLVDYKDYEEFEWVALERKFNARPVETDRVEGWAFFELDTVDAAKGGAARAHIDALRMISVLLAHWDNKTENQRIVCLSGQWPEDTPCPAPFLLLQDVGATFGPPKLDLAAWEQARMWEDRATCTLSMRDLPFEGATFGQARVTESGRRFTAALVSRISDDQLTELFTHARFAEERGPFNVSSPISEWVRVFKAKVRAISEGPQCPAA
jgi:hypothetical protein